MKAIHVISTAPFFARHCNGAYFMEKFEMYNAVLSALAWRKLNGEILLATDSEGANYIKRIGLETVWNEIAVVVPETLEGINPRMFWAAGKLFALREISAPAVMLDTDFIVWKKLKLEDEIVAAHKEPLTEQIYPPKSYFGFRQREFLDDLDWSVMPVNTAFLYLPDEAFKQYYVGQSLAFMKSAADCDDYLCYMVFAEQRLLAMCAQKLSVKVKTLLDKDELFYPQDSFTHLWGAKQALRSDLQQCADFCRRCRDRIRSDFPDFEYVIGRIEASFLQNK